MSDITKKYYFSAEPKDATKATVDIFKKNKDKITAEYLQLEEAEYKAVTGRIIYNLAEEDVYDYDGSLIFDHKSYFKRWSGECPETVNPYIWQTNQKNDFAAVIELSKDFYVVTGVDVVLIGFAKTKNGWIIQDPGNFPNTARISLRAVETALGVDIKNNIKAIIISHTHPDHYGGISAFIDEDQIGKAEDGKVLVIAPGNYEQSLIDDNLYAGVIMSRRLQYQAGALVAPGAKGTVGCGLNSPLSMGPEISFMMPNLYIDEDKTINIDGVDVDFRLTPDTETRAHMATYFRENDVLYLGDNAMGTLHNTYTMRGARVRDANFWGNLFYKLNVEYGDRVKAVYQGHGLAHVKDSEEDTTLNDFLLNNATAYKFTSDQALLMANKGYSLTDIGHMNIPEEVGKVWYVRPHYGHYSFNARGAYMRYLGFYDGNPVNLLPLTKVETAKKLVEYIGDEDIVLDKAIDDYDKGEYQWVATITNYLVYLNPKNEKARLLCADALEQLGYQAESGLWRNAYLSGAYELRTKPEDRKKAMPYMNNESVIPYVSADLLLDYLGINFDGERGLNEREEFIFDIRVSNECASEYHRVQLYKGTVFHVEIAKEDIKADEEVIEITKKELYQLASGKREKNTGNTILDKLAQYVVDTSQYQNANLIEPLA